MSIDLVKVKSSATAAAYGPSPNLWAGCNFEAMRCDPARGIVYEARASNLPNLLTTNAEGALGNMATWADAGSTLVDAAVANGGVTLTTDASDNDSILLRQRIAAFQIANTKGKFWFEARVMFASIANTKCGAFIGLLEAATPSSDVPIVDGGTLSDNNLVGFHRLEGDGDYLDTVYKADGVTAVTVKADAQVLVAAQWYNLGMKFDGSKLSFWVDGVQLADTKGITGALGTDFPSDVLLSPVISMKNATTEAEAVSFAWVRCAQEY